MNEVKKGVKSFVLKGTMIFTLVLFLMTTVCYSLNLNLELIFHIFLFLFLTLLSLYAIWGYTIAYIYFKKKKGHSIIEIPFETMKLFEKKYYTTTKKIGYLFFIILPEIWIFFFLIFIFLLIK
jgi:hypothetical protein